MPSIGHQFERLLHAGHLARPLKYPDLESWSETSEPRKAALIRTEKQVARVENHVGSLWLELLLLRVGWHVSHSQPPGCWEMGRFCSRGSSCPTASRQKMEPQDGCEAWKECCGAGRDTGLEQKVRLCTQPFQAFLPRQQAGGSQAGTRLSHSA